VSGSDPRQLGPTGYRPLRVRDTCHRRNPGAATVRAALAIAEHAVRGSRTALRRALTALVDNAISHTPAGGHLTRVWPGRTRAG